MDPRIKKLEDKIRELEEQQDEVDSNIEDIYSTLNDFKHPDCNTYSDTHLDINSSKNINTNENIAKYIDHLISLNPERYPPYAKREALSFLDYIVNKTNSIKGKCPFSSTSALISKSSPFLVKP